MHMEQLIYSPVLIANACSECRSYRSGPLRPGGASWHFLMGEVNRNRMKNPGDLR